MEKQTGFNLDQLKSILDNGNYTSQNCNNCSCGTTSHLSKRAPLCLILNEVGVILLLEKDLEAVPVLENFLDHENSSVKFIAYCYLKKAEKIKIDTPVSLGAFENDPKNYEIIQAAEKKFLEEQMYN